MNIYESLLIAGVPISNHESDLYCKVTPASRVIVGQYRQTDAKCVSVFVSNIDGTAWYELPFMYSPFWQSRAGAGGELAVQS